MTIDVSELMTDPELVQPYTVKRPTITLGNHGVASKTYQEIPMIGVVEPASPREVAMLEEGDRSSEIMNFWGTQELLPSDGTGTVADIVIFGGEKYMVLKSERWGAVGSGYFKATTKAITL